MDGDQPGENANSAAGLGFITTHLKRGHVNRVWRSSLGEDDRNACAQRREHDVLDRAILLVHICPGKIQTQLRFSKLRGCIIFSVFGRADLDSKCHQGAPCH